MRLFASIILIELEKIWLGIEPCPVAAGKPSATGTSKNAGEGRRKNWRGENSGLFEFQKLFELSSIVAKERPQLL